MKNVNVIAAGGVILDNLKEFKFYLVYPTGGFGGGWTIPKGRLEKGENLEKGALRETEEETGLKARILAFVGEGKSSPYTDVIENETVVVHSVSHYFLMQKVGGNTNMHDWETEKVELVDYNRARTMLKKTRDLKILDQAKQLFEKMFGQRNKKEARRALKLKLILKEELEYQKKIKNRKIRRKHA